MGDEFGELRRANPVSAAELDRAVWLSDDALIEAMMEAPSTPSRVRPLLVAGCLGVVVAAMLLTAVMWRASGATSSGEVASVTTSVATGVLSSGFDSRLDLLAVHLDFAHLDDGQSAVASREVTDRYGLTPIVVAGTQSLAGTEFTHDYAEIMRAAWGEAWLDAGSDREGAVAQTANRWAATIEGGGRVWVAEGGVSDFTSEVVEDFMQRWPNLEVSSRVTVVQHSQRNHDATLPGLLDDLDQRIDYVRIADGNAANETAALNGESERLVTAALAGPTEPRWAEAFDYLPAEEVDFSDTVAVLHILGVDIGTVRDLDDFAAVFLEGGQAQ